ncbi:hypothetical protein FOZ61_007485 [Perkinsus olseni]|uniref:Sirohydrochlorin cobaltochelatase n=1 Tax=Perkinsus olseni TaxID=32597 RepID=A0A7J6L8X1_PEROL|nr:hypothetical protein FOZ61_007485 [Perkinsus olseni]
MSSQGSTLQNYNSELVKCIEDLREKREELNRQILKEEEDKGKIQKELAVLTDRLQRINESLVRKTQARNEYDKTIQETEAAYMKILESSQTLLHVLKRESVNLTKKKQLMASSPHRIGLILIDHGSPSPVWNKSHEDLLPKVEEELERRGLATMFYAVRWCHMEFVQPSVAETMNKLEAEGVSRVIAIPVFISVSSHSERDLPNILNIRFHPDQDSEMVRYTGHIPVTLCTPLDHQYGLLPKVIAQQAVDMMTDGRDPTRTAAVVLSHGDGCEHFWQHLHRDINDLVIERTGIKSCEGVYVQTLRSPAAQRRLRDYCKGAMVGVDTLLVLTAFNGTSGATFVTRAADGLAKRNEEGLPSGVVGCQTLFLSSPLMVSALVDCAVHACQVSTGRKEVPELQGEEKKSVPPYNPPFWLTRDAAPGHNDRTIIRPSTDRKAALEGPKTVGANNKTVGA